MSLRKKLLKLTPLLALGLAQAAFANNGRYDRGYANDGPSQSCIVMLAYQHSIASVGPRVFLPCLHPGW